MNRKEDITRKCIVTGEIKDKAQLLRFVVTPDGMVVPDLYKKLSGKGIYVSCSYATLAKAVSKGLFAKVMKKGVKTAPDLLQIVENLLRRSALNAISLAKKSGNVVIGLDKVTEAIKFDKVDFVLEANDAGADGHKKIQHKAENLIIYRLFSVEELDKALDKVNTVYLAFLKGGMSNMVKNNFEKLSEFFKDKDELK